MISLTSPVETRAHCWPAGAKLSALCVATFVLFTVDSLVAQVVPFTLVLVLYALPGRVFFAAGLRRIWSLWPFVVILVLWHLISGVPAVGLGIALQMLTAVGLANLVTMTTRLSDMMGVLRWVLTPLRKLGLQTARVEMALALVVRFTPVLIEKGQMLRLAWRARAARAVGWRIVLPFAVLAIDDAEHVAEALRARGGL